MQNFAVTTGDNRAAFMAAEFSGPPQFVAQGFVVIVSGESNKSEETFGEGYVKRLMLLQTAIWKIHHM